MSKKKRSKMVNKMHNAPAHAHITQIRFLAYFIFAVILAVHHLAFAPSQLTHTHTRAQSFRCEHNSRSLNCMSVHRKHLQIRIRSRRSCVCVRLPFVLYRCSILIVHRIASVFLISFSPIRRRRRCRCVWWRIIGNGQKR